MEPDLWQLYRQMFKSRLFEEAVTQLWQEGRISGEMHLGTGEEAIMAGVVSQLQDGDAMALDHRGTSPLLMRGVDPVSLLREFLGRADGLCAGMGGHMHLFSPDHLAASSGIVGASGPAAVGFALAGQQLRPQTLAVAFFGEGAINQGMMMEAMNLAVVWQLPVLFVCKDNEWAITTRSSSVMGGPLAERARGFGMTAVTADGTDVETVWHVAREAMARARTGDGPTFLHLRCLHLEGHFLGDALLRIVRQPVSEMKQMAGPLLRSSTSRKGASWRQRVDSLGAITALIGKAFRERDQQDDPLSHLRQKLSSAETQLQEVEEEVVAEIQQILRKALAPNERNQR